MKSRKFLFACLWNLFVIAGMVVTIIIGKDVPYMERIVVFAGTITAAYVGIQGWADGNTK